MGNNLNWSLITNLYNTFILASTSKPCVTVKRWVLRLQFYQYKMIYRSGKCNIADPLSTLCANSTAGQFENDDCICQVVHYAVPINMSLSEIGEYSRKDAEIQAVKEGMNSGISAKDVSTYRVFENELCLFGEILLRGTRIVIPQELRLRTLELAHVGHLGIVSMKKRLRRKVWWPGMDAEAAEVVKKCKGCTLVSPPDPPKPLKRRELPTQPWADLAIDYLQSLPGGENILVVIDYFSRFIETGISKTITTESTIRMLHQIFTRLGYPYTIIADNGPQFGKSMELRKYCEVNNINLYSSIPYWPQQNGEVE